MNDQSGVSFSREHRLRDIGEEVFTLAHCPGPEDTEEQVGGGIGARDGYHGIIQLIRPNLSPADHQRPVASSKGTAGIEDQVP